MAMQRQFTAVIEREGDGYVALCPELDVASQGDTIEQARGNLAEAVALFLEAASPDEVHERLHSEVYVTRLESIIRQLRLPRSLFEESS
jgi:predicted RNase H-like HicB family nuclease